MPAPQAPNQAPPHARPAVPAGPDMRMILRLATAGLGLLAYIVSFFDGPLGEFFAGVPGLAVIGAATLVALTLLPKSPDTLLPAVPLTVYAALALLHNVVTAGGGAIGIVLMLLVFMQAAVVIAALLLDAGMIDIPVPKQSAPASPQPNPLNQRPGPPQGGWNKRPVSGPPMYGAQGSQHGPQGSHGTWHPGPAGGQQQPPWNTPDSSGSPQAGKLPATPQKQGSQADESAGQANPGQTNPPQGSSAGQGSPGQQGGGSSPNSGPQGTQKMPHPGAGLPRDF